MTGTSPIGAEFATMLRALDGLALRHRTTAANIANQSVPGYKRRVVSFEDQLERASRGGDFRPSVSIDRSPGDVDGNNVRPEKEVGVLTRVELTYQTLTRVLQMKASHMRSAISGR